MHYYSETEVLSKSRLEHLISSNHEHIFWNDLKETIMSRQLRENEGLRRAAEQVSEYERRAGDYEEKVHQELIKEAEEGADQKAGKLKNLTNRCESKFNASQKSIEIIVESGRDISRF